MLLGLDIGFLDYLLDLEREQRKKTVGVTTRAQAEKQAAEEKVDQQQSENNLLLWRVWIALWRMTVMRGEWTVMSLQIQDDLQKEKWKQNLMQNVDRLVLRTRVCA